MALASADITDAAVQIHHAIKELQSLWWKLEQAHGEECHSTAVTLANEIQKVTDQVYRRMMATGACLQCYRNSRLFCQRTGENPEEEAT